MRCAPGSRSPSPPAGTALTIDGALEIIERIGFPALVRPSYVLGGRAMEIVYDDDDLRRGLAGGGGLRVVGPRGRTVGGSGPC